MNPVIATGILSTTKNIIENLSLSNLKETKEVEGADFDFELANAVSIKKNTIKNLKSDFLKCDKINKFIESDTGTQIHLESRADGSMKLLSSSGRFLILEEGTKPCKLGRELYSICLEQKVNLSDLRSNAVLVKG